MPKHAHLATTTSDALATTTELDALYGDAGGEGLENVNRDDIVLPRLAIMQTVSPQVADGTSRPGHIVNTVTGEDYGSTLRFFALISYTSRVQWASRQLNSEIECQSRDGIHGSMTDARHNHGKCAGCPLAEWTDDQAPLCTEFRNLLLLPFAADADATTAVTNPAPAVYSAKRASLSAVRKFLGAAQLLRKKVGNTMVKPPLWASLYEFKTVKVTNDKGNYFLPAFTRLGYVEDADMFRALRTAYDAAKEALPKIAVTEATTDSEVPAEVPADDEGDY
jgi:hypothetical protein